MSASTLLDHTAYPHIVDMIINFASPPALLAIRMTSKAFCAKADAILFKHVVLPPHGGGHPYMFVLRTIWGTRLPGPGRLWGRTDTERRRWVTQLRRYCRVLDIYDQLPFTGEGTMYFDWTGQQKYRYNPYWNPNAYWRDEWDEGSADATAALGGNNDGGIDEAGGAIPKRRYEKVAFSAVKLFRRANCDGYRPSIDIPVPRVTESIDLLETNPQALQPKGTGPDGLQTWVLGLHYPPDGRGLHTFYVDSVFEGQNTHLVYLFHERPAHTSDPPSPEYHSGALDTFIKGIADDFRCRFIRKITIIGVDSINRSLLRFPREWTRQQLEEALLGNIAQAIQDNPNEYAEDFPDDEDGEPYFRLPDEPLDFISFLSHDEYKAQVGAAQYALETEYLETSDEI